MEPSFPQFYRLPVELRCNIWNLAMPHPRVIEISYHNKFSHMLYPPNSLKPNNTLIYGSSVSPPSLLHVCRESRAEMQRKYKLVFQSACSPRPIYFNFETDVLFFSDRRYTRQNFWRHIANPYLPYADFLDVRSFTPLIPRLCFPEIKAQSVLENYYMHCFLQSTSPEEVAQVRRIAYEIHESERKYDSNCVALRLFGGLREYLMVPPSKIGQSRGERLVGFTLLKPSAQTLSFAMELEMMRSRQTPTYSDKINAVRQLFPRLKSLDMPALYEYHGTRAFDRAKEESEAKAAERKQREMGMLIVPNQPGWWASWNTPKVAVGFIVPMTELY